MKIAVVKEFKSHGIWAHVGEVRFVSEEHGNYFCSQGWATSEEYVAQEGKVEIPKQDVALEVQNGAHYSSAASPV